MCNLSKIIAEKRVLNEDKRSFQPALRLTMCD